MSFVGVSQDRLYIVDISFLDWNGKGIVEEFRGINSVVDSAETLGRTEPERAIALMTEPLNPLTLSLVAMLVMVVVVVVMLVAMLVMVVVMMMTLVLNGGGDGGDDDDLGNDGSDGGDGGDGDEKELTRWCEK